MSRVFSTLLLLVWGAWFGSLLGIFLAVKSINITFPIELQDSASSNRGYFGIVTSQLFHLYEFGQLGLAGLALIFAFAWQLCRGAARVKIALFVLFALATLASVTGKAYVTPQIDRLRDENKTQTEEFRQMHGLSFGIYGGNVLLMLVAGVLIPIGIARESRVPEPNV